MNWNDQDWPKFILGDDDDDNFYVIHLHPSNWKTRGREADLILADIASLPKDSKVMLVGDFNTFSTADRKYYAHGKLESFFSKRDGNGKEKNLRGGKIDYSVIAKFTNAGLIDLEHLKRGKDYKFTGSFPTKIEKSGDHGSARRLNVLSHQGLHGYKRGRQHSGAAPGAHDA